MHGWNHEYMGWNKGAQFKCLFTVMGLFSSRAPLLQALIGLFELPEDGTIPDDEHFIEIEDTPGYQTAYSKLMFAGKHEVDPVADVQDAKLNLAKMLGKLSTGQPGRVSND